MYERNAIILERYFEKAFGYDNKNSIKTNFKDYKELVEDLENYKNVSDEEDVIIQEYDAIASRIREIQDKQTILNNKNNKYQEERANIFQNIDENSNNMIKKINSTNSDIQSINEQIEENAKLYVETVNEFNEKSDIRTKIGKKRRVIEEKYNNKLEETLDNYSNISLSQVKQAKQFGNLNIAEIKKQLQEKIRKNGEKEKVPFNEEVVSKAINLSIDIQKKETEVLVNVYEKTNRLFSEIKNGSAKIAKHKKLIKDSQSKLEFINAMKEYLVQFLDNERITAVNGVEEHNKLMKEACKNIEDDIVQIDNLYTLLLKEISKKIMKKNYNDLYKLEYLKDLENKSEDFEEEIKKLNLPVTIINPNYWRIEGMKRIYNAFNKCVTEYYGRDLSKYTAKFEKTKEEENKEKKNIFELTEEKFGKRDIKETQKEDGAEDESFDSKKELIDKNTKKNSIDKKIDLVLEMNKEKEDEDWEDDWEEDDEDKINLKEKNKNDEDDEKDKESKEKNKKKNSSKSKKKGTNEKGNTKRGKKKKIEETEDEEEIEEDDNFFDDFDEEKMDEIEYVDEDEEDEEDVVENRKKSNDIEDILEEDDDMEEIDDEEFDENDMEEIDEEYINEDDLEENDEEDIDEDDLEENDEEDIDEDDLEEIDEEEDIDEEDIDELDDEDIDEDDNWDDDWDDNWEEDEEDEDELFEEKKSDKMLKNKAKEQTKEKEKKKKTNKNNTNADKNKKIKETKSSKPAKSSKKSKETKKDKNEKSSKYVPKDTAKNEAKEDWGNEFINIKEKNNKKKRGWFFR